MIPADLLLSTKNSHFREQQCTGLCCMAHTGGVPLGKHNMSYIPEWFGPTVHRSGAAPAERTFAALEDGCAVKEAVCTHLLLLRQLVLCDQDVASRAGCINFVIFKAVEYGRVCATPTTLQQIFFGEYIL
jgi:hypothetical protein